MYVEFEEVKYANLAKNSLRVIIDLVLIKFFFDRGKNLMEELSNLIFMMHKNSLMVFLSKGCGRISINRNINRNININININRNINISKYKYKYKYKRNRFKLIEKIFSNLSNKFNLFLVTFYL